MDSAACRARFGENLARARRRAGLSQEEAGWRASLHRTEVGLLERGERLPRIDTLVKLSASLSVTPNDLLDGIQWIPGSTRLGRFSVSEAREPASTAPPHTTSLQVIAAPPRPLDKL